MANITVNPTANTTPDPGFGGTAVDTPSNTGHALTDAASSDGGGNETNSCRWSGFPAVGGQIVSATLKVTHSSLGALSGFLAGNGFVLQYSLNSGGAWVDIVNRSNFTASEGPTTASVALSTSQDLTQVLVRDVIGASTVNAGETAFAQAEVSGIKIEVVTVAAQMINCL